MKVPLEEHATNQAASQNPHDQKPVEGELTDRLKHLANASTGSKRVLSSLFFVDITDALRSASKSKILLLQMVHPHDNFEGIQHGELVKDDSLSLFDAVSALEVGDYVWFRSPLFLT